MNLKSPIAKIFVVGDLFKTHVKQKKNEKVNPPLRSSSQQYSVCSNVEIRK